MFQCPVCSQTLARVPSPAGLLWRCGTCAGCALSLPVLRRIAEPASVQTLWHRAADAPPGRPCPVCRRRMVEVDVEGADARLRLDVCRPCQMVWCDARELEALPPRRSAPAAPDTHWQQVARVRREERREEERFEAEVWRPRYFWTWLGLPVEYAPPALAQLPLATWITAAVVTLVSAIGFADPRLVEALAFVPADPWRHGGVTWLTPFFVHAGLLHLVGNLYFFLVFGDNVEDLIGRARMLTLLAIATVAGGVLHLLGDPRPAIPCVGASGGIAGVLAFYALRFPRAELVLRLPVGGWWRQATRLPAIVAFALWLGLQLLLSLRQASGWSSVSGLAHLGGALAGAVAFLFWRDPRARPPQRPTPRPQFVWR